MWPAVPTDRIPGGSTVASIHLSITGMTCEHCRKRVEDALNGVKGVIGAFVDLPGASADVDFESGSVTSEALIEAVESAGYQARPSE